MADLIAPTEVDALRDRLEHAEELLSEAQDRLQVTDSELIGRIERFLALDDSEQDPE